MDEMEKKVPEHDGETRELTLDELEQAEGGYIVYRGTMRDYYVVDDNTGEKLASAFWNGDAKYYAEQYGVSKKEITVDQYKKLFGRKP